MGKLRDYRPRPGDAKAVTLFFIFLFSVGRVFAFEGANVLSYHHKEHLVSPDKAWEISLKMIPAKSHVWTSNQGILYFRNKRKNSPPILFFLMREL